MYETISNRMRQRGLGIGSVHTKSTQLRDNCNWNGSTFFGGGITRQVEKRHSFDTGIAAQVICIEISILQDYSSVWVCVGGSRILYAEINLRRTSAGLYLISQPYKATSTAAAAARRPSSWLFDTENSAVYREMTE